MNHAVMSAACAGSWSGSAVSGTDVPERVIHCEGSATKRTLRLACLDVLEAEEAAVVTCMPGMVVGLPRCKPAQPCTRRAQLKHQEMISDMLLCAADAVNGVCARNVLSRERRLSASRTAGSARASEKRAALHPASKNPMVSTLNVIPAWRATALLSMREVLPARAVDSQLRARKCCARSLGAGQYTPSMIPKAHASRVAYSVPRADWFTNS